MRPSHHEYETRGKSAHSERALVAKCFRINPKSDLPMLQGDDTSNMDLGLPKGNETSFDMIDPEWSAFPCG
jgi:hypothetical protein